MAEENVESPNLNVEGAAENDGNPPRRDFNEGPGRGFGGRGRGRGRGGRRGGFGDRGRGGRFSGPPGGPDGDDQSRGESNNPNDNEFGGGGVRKRRWGTGPSGPRGGDGEEGGGGGFRRGPWDGPGGRNPDDRLFDKVSQLSGPTYDLPPIEETDKKFSNRARLYIGNIAPDATEEDIVQAFSNFGETSELFINKDKSFGFIKMDYHINAEKAKRELDGSVIKGKPLKIRFAPVGANIKVKNLTPYVTNELLYHAFSVFGEIEKCTVVVDDRGKPMGEGIVEYVRKGSASLAIRKCDELCYFLTSSLRPVIVTQHDVVDETEGLPDKNLPKRSSDFGKEREIGPRFAKKDGFDSEYGMRWKQLHELFTQREQALKQELEIEKDKLENEMELTRYEHETEMLREQIRNREMDRDRQKREWEMKERQAEEMRVRMQDQLRNQQEEMHSRINRQEDEIRRRQQENSLFMQAHQLDNLLKEEEQSFNDDDIAPEFAGNLMDSKPFPQFGDNRGGHWVKENRGPPPLVRDDFANKRRRFN